MNKVKKLMRTVGNNCNYMVHIRLWQQALKHELSIKQSIKHNRV